LSYMWDSSASSEAATLYVVVCTGASSATSGETRVEVFTRALSKTAVFNVRVKVRDGVRDTSVGGGSGGGGSNSSGGSGGGGGGSGSSRGLCSDALAQQVSSLLGVRADTTVLSNDVLTALDRLLNVRDGGGELPNTHPAATWLTAAFRESAPPHGQ
jgi:hypothetical protein